MEKTLIIGFGNLLKGDDGAGVHLIGKLAGSDLPVEVELIDGGVNSFAALATIHSAAQAILIDSMAGGGAPGTIYRLTKEQLAAMPTSPALSLHEVSLADSLHLAERMGALPPVLIYGIEPATLELTMQLSQPVAMAVDKVIGFIEADLSSIISRKGYECV